ncbi:AsmA family protein [Asaia sp. HN010]|uniref:AsmA family protein n=1 Tax=Asaia sp. HN010 TaxID=3081233 RepID=UPI00301761D3
MRRLAAVLIVLLVLATGLAVSADFLIDRSDLKSDVIAAVKRQTGRDLAMARFSVGILPWPSVSAHEVALSDIGGKPNVPMLQARDIRASIALIPLLWREIRLENVILQRGAVMLHRDEAGQANWDFHAQPTEKGTGQAKPSHPAARWSLKIGSAKLDRMAFSLDDRFAHHGGSVSIDHAEFDGLASSAPYLDIHGMRGETPFRVNGHIGPLSLFQGANPPWALSLGATLGKEGKQQDWLNFDGQVSDMRHMRGFSGVLRGEMASLKDIETLFPNANMPSVTGFGGEIGVFDADPQGKTPRLDLSRLGVNHLHLHLDSAPSWHGVSVSALHADAETLSSALTVTATLRGPMPALAVQGAFGTLAQAGTSWQTALETPLAVSVDLREAARLGKAEGLHGHISGLIGASETALSLDGGADTLPVRQSALHEVTLKGGFERDGSGKISLKALTLNSHEAAAVLDATAQNAAHPEIEGKLHFQHLDLDALAALWTKPKAEQATAPAVPALPNPVASLTASHQATPSDGNASPADVPAGQVAHPAVPVNGGFSWSRLASQGRANLDIAADTVRFNAADYTGISAQAHLETGRLTLDSVKGSGNGMTLSGKAVYDVSVKPASLTLSLTPFLFPATLAQNLLAMPGFFRGPLMLVGQLEARGDTREALIASLNGHLGLSMVGGSIATGPLGPYLGDSARALLPHGDLSVRCLGLHASFTDGHAQFDTLGMEAGALSLSGHGNYGLVDRTLDLHLLPRIGIAGTGASTPVLVTGTLEAPKAQQEASSGGRFEVTIGGSEPDTCPAVLEAARENLPGEAAPERKKHNKAAELLHGLGLLH